MANINGNKKKDEEEFKKLYGNVKVGSNQNAGYSQEALNDVKKGEYGTLPRLKPQTSTVSNNTKNVANTKPTSSTNNVSNTNPTSSGASVSSENKNAVKNMGKWYSNTQPQSPDYSDLTWGTTDTRRLTPSEMSPNNPAKFPNYYNLPHAEELTSDMVWANVAEPNDDDWVVFEKNGGDPVKTYEELLYRAIYKSGGASPKTDEEVEKRKKDLDDFLANLAKNDTGYDVYGNKKPPLPVMSYEQSLASKVTRMAMEAEDTTGVEAFTHNLAWAPTRNFVSTIDAAGKLVGIDNYNDAQGMRNYQKYLNETGTETEGGKKFLEAAEEISGRAETNLAMSLVPGGKFIAPAVNAGSTVGNTIDSLEERGINGKSAAAQALGAGGVDYALSVAPLGDLIANKVPGLKGLLNNSSTGAARLAKFELGNALVGGIELGSAQAINEAVDALANQDKSIFALSKKNYMSQGMSEEEATIKAWQDLGGRVGTQAAVGAGTRVLNPFVKYNFEEKVPEYNPEHILADGSAENVANAADDIVNTTPRLTDSLDDVVDDVVDSATAPKQSKFDDWLDGFADRNISKRGESAPEVKPVEDVTVEPTTTVAPDTIIGQSADGGIVETPTEFIVNGQHISKAGLDSFTEGLYRSRMKNANMPSLDEQILEGYNALSDIDKARLEASLSGNRDANGNLIVDMPEAPAPVAEPTLPRLTEAPEVSGETMLTNTEVPQTTTELPTIKRNKSTGTYTSSDGKYIISKGGNGWDVVDTNNGGDPSHVTTVRTLAEAKDVVKKSYGSAEVEALVDEDIPTSGKADSMEELANLGGEETTSMPEEANGQMEFPFVNSTETEPSATVPRVTNTEPEIAQNTPTPQGEIDANRVPDATKPIKDDSQSSSMKTMKDVTLSDSTVPPTSGNETTSGDGTKTSKYYTNTMRKTPTNRMMDDETYAFTFDENDFKYVPKGNRKVAQEVLDEIATRGTEEVEAAILNGDFGSFAEDGSESFNEKSMTTAILMAEAAERKALELEAQGQDATRQWIKANQLHRKAKEQASLFGHGLETLKMWSKETPSGAVDYATALAETKVDAGKTKGYSFAVDNLADEVADIIASGENVENRIKEAFDKGLPEYSSKAHKIPDYDITDCEQMVLDFINDPKYKKKFKSATALAEEAGRLIKQKMGCSTLSSKDQSAMLELFKKARDFEPGSREYNVLISHAMQILDANLPSTFSNKLKSLIYDNMLASLKTMVTRNFGGNVVFNAIDTASKPFAVAADVVASKFTGNRTQALSSKAIIAGAKGFGHGVSDWGKDVKEAIKTLSAFNTTRSGDDTLYDALNAVSRSFKTQSKNGTAKGLNNVLGAYDYIVRKGMELGDRPIYEAKYAMTKAELQNVVDKYGDKGLRTALPEKANISTDDLIEFISINEALTAVMQNDSAIKKAAQSLKKALSETSREFVGVDLLSITASPFIEVPANMAAMFNQYTPGGIVSNVSKSYREHKQYGHTNQRRATTEAGRNLLGLGLLGGAAALAAKGFVSDPYSEDEDERKAQQNNGYQEYALQWNGENGKTQVDVSDVPVGGPMLRGGKMLSDAYENEGMWGALKTAPMATGAVLTDSLYQGINKLTGANNKYDSSENLFENAKDLVASSVGSMGIPTILRQIAQYNDPYKRDLGDYGTSEYNKNLAINSSFWRQRLNPKIDTSGNPVLSDEGNTGFRRFVDTFLVPWQISHPDANKGEATLYADFLKEQTNGETNPQVHVFKRSSITDTRGFDKDKYSHDEDFYPAQKEYYEKANELANFLIESDEFQAFPYEKQGEILDDLYTGVMQWEKENFINSTDKLNGEEPYTASSGYQELVKAIRLGNEAVKDYFVSKEAANELGMTLKNYNEKNLTYDGGAEQYKQDQTDAIRYGFVQKDGSANMDAYDKAQEILGDASDAKYQAYADYWSGGYDTLDKQVPALMGMGTFTDKEKGMLLSSPDPNKLKNNQKAVYDIGGYEGVYKLYLLKYLADGSVSKDKKNGSIDADEREKVFTDPYYSPYLYGLSDDMIKYLYDGKGLK